MSVSLPCIFYRYGITLIFYLLVFTYLNVLNKIISNAIIFKR